MLFGLGSRTTILISVAGFLAKGSKDGAEKRITISLAKHQERKKKKENAEMKRSIYRHYKPFESTKKCITSIMTQSIHTQITEVNTDQDVNLLPKLMNSYKETPS